MIHLEGLRRWYHFFIPYVESFWFNWEHGIHAAQWKDLDQWPGGVTHIISYHVKSYHTVWIRYTHKLYTKFSYIVIRWSKCDISKSFKAFLGGVGSHSSLQRQCLLIFHGFVVLVLLSMKSFATDHEAQQCCAEAPRTLQILVAIREGWSPSATGVLIKTNRNNNSNKKATPKLTSCFIFHILLYQRLPFNLQLLCEKWLT